MDGTKFLRIVHSRCDLFLLYINLVFSCYFSRGPISYPESSGSLVSGLVARRDSGEMEFFSIFLIGYSGNNEIGEAEVGSMLTLPSIMSWTSQETSAICQRGQQVTLLVRDWRISIHLLVSAFG